MSAQDQERIVALQAQLRIAQLALDKIRSGGRNPETTAVDALEAMFALGPKQPLQGIVGHIPRSRP